MRVNMKKTKIMFLGPGQGNGQSFWNIPLITGEKIFSPKLTLFYTDIIESEKEDKDQESIQSSTTPNPVYQ